MYEIIIQKKAKKILEKMDPNVRKNIIQAIDSLKINPKPNSSKQLVGQDIETWRMRVGDYRIIYTINEDKLIVLVIHLGHRKDVYDSN